MTIRRDRQRARRLLRLPVLGVAAAALVLTGAGTGIASAHTPATATAPTAGRYGVYPMGIRSTPPSTLAANDLVFHGGEVAIHPHIYLVFWGTQWQSDTTGAHDYIKHFYEGLGQTGDNWSRVTSQYHGSNGSPAFSGTVLTVSWTDLSGPAPANATSGQIAAEAQKAFKLFNGTAGPSSDVIVVSPHGTHPDGFPNGGFCAWHSETNHIPYTNMPYVSDAGSSCAANSVSGPLDGFSVVSGHEYLEAVTDPYPDSGWVDSTGAENADKCVGINLHSIKLPTGSFAVQPTWSNQTHACAG
jgi:serine protease